MRIIITGATGFIGKRLVGRCLREGHSVVALSRNPASAKQSLGSGVQTALWRAEIENPPAEAIEGADAVVHLAGESVSKRWTKTRKQEIRDSRVLGTRNLVSGINAAGAKPKVLISGSAIGIYGDRGDEELTENSSAATDFLAGVCAAWEGEAMKVGSPVRCVRLRIGVVLGPEGGALGKLLPLFKLGLGGPMGSGKQWMSWIHADDVVGLILHAATNENVKGAMNATAPEPVTNRDFSMALGRALHRPAIVLAPALALNLVLGEMSSIVLDSQKVRCEVAERIGYSFRFPRLEEALAEIVSTKR